jgi:NADH-quinone oxidoreductase subunit C
MFNNYAIIQGVDKWCRWMSICPAARLVRRAFSTQFSSCRRRSPPSGPARFGDRAVTTTAAPVASARPPRGRRAADLLARELPDAVVRTEEHVGEVTVFVHVEHLVGALTLLRDHDGGLYRLPLFVTAVDWPDREPAAPRYDVVYQLRSLHHNDECRLVVQVPEEAPRVPTAERVFAAMDWHERETFDLFGIEFVGHHDLR